GCSYQCVCWCIRWDAGKAGKSIWILQGDLCRDGVAEPRRLCVSGVQVLVERRESLREDIIDERLVLCHLLLGELSHRVEGQLTRLADSLRELRDKTGGQS